MGYYRGLKIVPPIDVVTPLGKVAIGVRSQKTLDVLRARDQLFNANNRTVTNEGDNLAIDAGARTNLFQAIYTVHATFLEFEVEKYGDSALTTIEALKAYKSPKPTIQINNKLASLASKKKKAKATTIKSPTRPRKTRTSRKKHPEASSSRRKAIKLLQEDETTSKSSSEDDDGDNTE